MTDFILLTGFLGSGKTTLLRDFLRHPEAADTAVIVNEAGAIDIDGAVLAEDTGDLPMALLANGCVCCSIANDLLYTIEALVEARERAGQGPFRRIVLETSGLARPGPIIRSLGELAPLGMKVSVTATADAAAPPFAAAALPLAAAQLAAAGTIIVTKPDLADPAPSAARLAGLNPLAHVVVEPDPGRRALAAFIPSAAPPMADPAPSGHPGIAVMTVRFDPAPLDDILAWLEDLSGVAGDRLLRLKGVLRPSDLGTPLLFQAVGTAFDQPRPFRGVAEEGLVVITHDLAAADIAALRPGVRVSANRLRAEAVR